MPHPPFRNALLAFAVVLAAASPVAAQDTGGSRFAARPYEAKLLRFLEIIGSVQFLRQLCEPSETAIWRESASAIIEAEGQTDARRARLTAAFNRGYRAFAAYGECNDAAIYAIDRYMREGTVLGRDILVRYGE